MISVCMATYNGEKYIEEQLASILNQLSIDDEVIISDDHSTDKTLEIIRELNDSRIKIFNNLGIGVVQNFENAIKNASGDLIFLSDQDDIWEPNKVRVCLDDFRMGYDLILSDCSIFESTTGEIIEESFFKFNASKKGISNNIIKNSYIGCCMAFTNELKQKALPFPKTIPMHDSWIGLIGEIFFKVNYNNSKLIRYRRHLENVSFTATGKSKFSFRKKFAFRVLLIYHLLLRKITRF
ncbi:glycosyltransferase family 2 protein [Flavobacterium daejeonense]|uniref:glycosyltransferase family 2 protein n=1 Tax=Flavobacterium daejeonense TaxID=350893 RepID=UPI00047D103C|nr:glycosyltransferase family 2 protein [Flavobacterium daejeonense]